MQHLTKPIKYLAYSFLAIFVLCASSILASTIYTDLMMPQGIEAQPDKPLSVKKINGAYQSAEDEARRKETSIRMSIPKLDQARIVQNTASGTCFTSAGKHTDCSGEPVASFVTVRLDGFECNIMANAHGVISTHCEHR